MSAPILFTLQETLQALRVARAAREYVERSEELADLLVKESPVDVVAYMRRDLLPDRS